MSFNNRYEIGVKYLSDNIQWVVIGMEWRNKKVEAIKLAKYFKTKYPEQVVYTLDRCGRKNLNNTIIY